MSSRQAPWQRDQRYYCAVCNAWMGNDRQSILIHENGKKHRENAERALQERRLAKQKKDKAERFLLDSLKEMEQTAMSKIGGNPGVDYYQNPPRLPNYHPVGPTTRNLPPTFVGSSPYNIQQSNPPAPTNKIPRSNYATDSTLQQERVDWQAQKLKREETNEKKRKNRDGDDDENTENDGKPSNEQSRVRIRPGEGCYTYDEANGKDNVAKEAATTYLEGNVYFGLLEKDMPVQIWIGPVSCPAEKRQSKNIIYWKNALVVQVVHRKLEAVTEQHDALQQPLVNVSYLSSPDATDETIEQKVSLDRIRIILGSDERIPSSVEEARLLAMGGEEIFKLDDKEANISDNQQGIDEATGLSGWSTVSIKKTSLLQKNREERKQYEESKALNTKKREAEEKRKAERRLEESRVANADDSALGAYDVWGKMDYKGVDISKEVNCSVEDSAKRLASAKSLSSGINFKKRVKKKGRKAVIRRTSADDDD